MSSLEEFSEAVRGYKIMQPDQQIDAQYKETVTLTRDLLTGCLCTGMFRLPHVDVAGLCRNIRVSNPAVFSMVIRWQLFYGGETIDYLFPQYLQPLRTVFGVQDDTTIVPFGITTQSNHYLPESRYQPQYVTFSLTEGELVPEFTIDVDVYVHGKVAPPHTEHVLLLNNMDAMPNNLKRYTGRFLQHSFHPYTESQDYCMLRLGAMQSARFNVQNFEPHTIRCFRRPTSHLFFQCSNQDIVIHAVVLILNDHRYPLQISTVCPGTTMACLCADGSFVSPENPGLNFSNVNTVHLEFDMSGNSEMLVWALSANTLIAKKSGTMGCLKYAS